MGSNFSECMSFMNPVREILPEITLKLEKMRPKDSEQSLMKSDDKISNTKLPKLDLLVFKGNPLE